MLLSLILIIILTQNSFGLPINVLSSSNLLTILIGTFELETHQESVLFQQFKHSGSFVLQLD